jgi:hypothetical protein
MNNITPEDIIAIIGVLGTLGAVFLYFRKPQEDLQDRQLGTDKELANKATILAQKEMENKAALLAQQVDSEKTLNEKKFIEMNSRIDNAIIALQIEVHAVDVRVDKMMTDNTAFHFEMSNKITEMSTLIKERLPPSSVQFLPSSS